MARLSVSDLMVERSRRICSCSASSSAVFSSPGVGTLMVTPCAERIRLSESVKDRSLCAPADNRGGERKAAPLSQRASLSIWSLLRCENRVLEDSRRGKFPSLWPTMFSVTKTGMKVFPLCTLKVWPTKSGVIVLRRDHVLIGFLPAVRSSGRSCRAVSTPQTGLFQERAIVSFELCAYVSGR